MRERMRMFTLPDQSKMEVEVLLHETVVQRIHEGMTASIRIEALTDGMMEGRLTSIAPVPMSDQNAESGNDAVYFLAHIQLEDLPPKLRPGMTAQVTIQTGPREGVLAVPASVVTVGDKQKFCYVGRDDSLERRVVKVNLASRDLLEVVDGLTEGEEVVLEPSLIPADATH